MSEVSKEAVEQAVKIVLESLQAKEAPPNGKVYKIVRTYSAGVFAGYIESRNGQEVVMTNARRLWYWSGAASLSQLAKDGVKKPLECKFPAEVSRVELLQVIEILDCTEASRKSIAGVKVWEM
jgi:hypothetical protein